MPQLHAKFHQNWWSGFWEISSQDTEGHSFIIIRICNANFILQHENCNRAFARSENRKIHMRSHTGDKPFNCKYAQEFNCTKKFSNSSDRAKHEQTHKDPVSLRILKNVKKYVFPFFVRTRQRIFSHQVRGKWIFSNKCDSIPRK